jgi:hypothetical protein
MVDSAPARRLRSALVGAAISDLIGAAWTVWGASGLPGAAAAIVAAAGVAVGLGMFAWTARLWRSAPRENGSPSMFSSRAYRLIVAGEVVALVGGNAALGALGEREYIVAWVAAVVGAHFLAFGRLFWAGFYWLGAALITAALAGTIVGLAGGGSGGVRATSGLLAAASLFLAGARTAVRANAEAHRAGTAYS